MNFIRSISIYILVYIHDTYQFTQMQVQISTIPKYTVHSGGLGDATLGNAIN